MARTSVVFPVCRAPAKQTTGVSAMACSRAGANERGYMGGDVGTDEMYGKIVGQSNDILSITKSADCRLRETNQS